MKYFLSLLFIIVLLSCQKEDEQPILVNYKVTYKLSFDHVAPYVDVFFIGKTGVLYDTILSYKNLFEYSFSAKTGDYIFILTRNQNYNVISEIYLDDKLYLSENKTLDVYNKYWMVAAKLP